MLKLTKSLEISDIPSWEVPQLDVLEYAKYLD